MRTPTRACSTNSTQSSRATEAPPGSLRRSLLERRRARRSRELGPHAGEPAARVVELIEARRRRRKGVDRDSIRPVTEDRRRGRRFGLQRSLRPLHLSSPAQGRTIVVSPHFDDAVLSLGAWLASIAGRGEHNEIVTVFGGDPTSDLPAAEWDRLCGFSTAGAAARARREEDRRACEILGIRGECLAFPDEQYGGHDADLIWASLGPSSPTPPESSCRVSRWLIPIIDGLPTWSATAKRAPAGRACTSSIRTPRNPAVLRGRGASTKWAPRPRREAQGLRSVHEPDAYAARPGHPHAYPRDAGEPGVDPLDRIGQIESHSAESSRPVGRRRWVPKRRPAPTQSTRRQPRKCCGRMVPLPEHRPSSPARGRPASNDDVHPETPRAAPPQPPRGAHPAVEARSARSGPSARRSSTSRCARLPRARSGDREASMNDRAAMLSSCWR